MSGAVAPFTGFRWPVEHHEHRRICADVWRRYKAAWDEVLAF